MSKKNQNFRQKVESKLEDKRRLFILKGQLVFKADDIDDAFVQLAGHFKGIMLDRGNDIALVGTDISIGLMENE